jgi:hypothetical protein
MDALDKDYQLTPLGYLLAKLPWNLDLGKWSFWDVSSSKSFFYSTGTIRVVLDTNHCAIRYLLSFQLW